MDIYSKRRRAQRLNDPNKTVEKNDPDDEIDPDDLELDYSGVVEKAGERTAECYLSRGKFGKELRVWVG